MRTNAERMKKGEAPYVWKNGKYEQLQLHHSRQDSRGALYELTEPVHQTKKGVGGKALHPYGNSSQHPERPVNRPAFNQDRKQYWKDRLKQLEGK
ncbi:HNH/ENDO VII family nuclease [Suttonella ornithocola]|uniref:LHH domain-containing protein n=1 Tax=Suttonella ornithocola TaxID=279832 RepID=A0A380MWI5_9GAMM|nr:HNH/ENDO VII family nuclease [Suttonella ornithocola]SUO96071.1 Uncharacterised protein [Suttonella ornithocola]